MRVYRTGASPAKFHEVFHEVFPSSSTRHERNDEPYPVNLQEPSQSKVAWLGLLRGRLLRTVCSRGALDGSKVRCRFFLAGAENLPACSCIPNGVLLEDHSQAQRLQRRWAQSREATFGACLVAERPAANPRPLGSGGGTRPRGKPFGQHRTFQPNRPRASLLSPFQLLSQWGPRRALS